ncbi:MAG TPA: hypothetical protein VF546_00015 [Pyrinomonadaceae bacterium]
MLAPLPGIVQGLQRGVEVRSATDDTRRKQEREELDRALELLGDYVYTSNNLIELTGPNFAPEKYPGVEKQREEMKAAYNECVQRWAKEQFKFEFWINRYRQRRPEVIGAWKQLSEAADQFNGCAQQWLIDHPTPTDIAGACASQRAAVEGRRAEFSEVFNRAEP